MQEVAARIKPHPTTPQTIGRLENGKRTLSTGWIERIAAALECDPAELLALPEGGDLTISGKADGDGEVKSGKFGTLTLRIEGEDAIAFSMGETMGQYRKGDVVVCRRVSQSDFAETAGSDCLVKTDDGSTYFGKLALGGDPHTFTLLPLNASGVVRQNLAAKTIALVSFLVRHLD